MEKCLQKKFMSENARYRILHGAYWIVCGINFSYLSFYLSGMGFHAGEIGVISALIGVVSALCQPILGRIADRSRRFGWKPQLLLMIMICIVSDMLLLLNKQKMMAGVLFSFLLVAVNFIIPLINSIAPYYEQRGIHIDYGSARGCGSLSYAIMTLIVGSLTLTFGIKAVPVSVILFPLLMLIVVWSLPYDKIDSKESVGKIKEKKNHKSASKKKSENLMKKYPAFFVVLVASVLTFSTHNLTCIFLLQMIEHVGGDSGHMGIALAISAVMEMPVMFLFSRIEKRVSSGMLLIISAISYAVKMILFFISGNVGMIYVVQVLQFCSYGIYAPASMKLADECMEEEDKVTGQALMVMSTNIASVISSLFGGWLIDAYGVSAMLAAGVVAAGAALPIWIAGIRMCKKK